ncbi:MAG: hypothetical protein KIT87_13345 [Anaerolineae bacterium]|nr:hypothetical protein [Anaerolineae bacterium]
MLDLRAMTQRLTQGQPAADMVVAQRGGANGAEAEAVPDAPASESASAADAPAAPSVDPKAVAQRVYELMRQELAVERDRRGRLR